MTWSGLAGGGVIVAMLAGSPAPKAPEAKTGASVPVVVKGLEFQAVGQPTWALTEGGGKADVELSLRVTNRSRRTLRLDRFDTIRMELKDGRGRPVPWQYGRDNTAVPEPLVLRPGEAKAISWRGTLEPGEDRRALRLGGRDDSGGSWWFDGLKTGRHVLSFVCRVDAHAVEKLESYRRRHRDAAAAGEQPPYWLGEARTEGLVVELADASGLLRANLQ